MGVPGPPWKVPKESDDMRHVGYQFYSVFSTENESRVDTSNISNQAPTGWPMGSLGPRPPQGVGGGVFISNEPNDIGYYSGLDMLQNCLALDTLWTDSADDTHGTLATVLSLPCYC